MEKEIGKDIDDLSSLFSLNTRCSEETVDGQTANGITSDLNLIDELKV